MHTWRAFCAGFFPCDLLSAIHWSFRDEIRNQFVTDLTFVGAAHIVALISGLLSYVELGPLAEQLLKHFLDLFSTSLSWLVGDLQAFVSWHLKSLQHIDSESDGCVRTSSDLALVKIDDTEDFEVGLRDTFLVRLRNDAL